MHLKELLKLGVVFIFGGSRTGRKQGKWNERRKPNVLMLMNVF